MPMRALRGLHVIRGGVGVPRLATGRVDQGADQAPDDGRLGTLEVDFSRFDTWYEIDSFWEGTFLERTRHGAFRRTIEQRGSQVKVLFNHGMDLSVGDKILGVPEVLEERRDSPHLEAALLDTSYNRDLAPGLAAGGYGSSFMFEVLAEEWEYEPEESDHNPDGLPERTITEVRLLEAGPVTWPANPDATASLRSGVDWWAEQVRGDQRRYDDLVRSFTAFRALHGLRTPPEDGPADLGRPGPKTSAPGDRPARHVDGVTAARRKRRLALIDMARSTNARDPGPGR